ncbi:MAG TPA: NUDIX hydrolase [Beijerinckiaceae bacterium]|jgi:8-oxo-dGTP pyrophosphatase MutT (NUDIX family)
MDKNKAGGAKKSVAKRGEKRLQYGALPYKRVGDDGLEVMLVTSRETKRWIIPKGWPMKDRKPYAAAKREAFEEAGVRGQIGKRPIGTFEYAKRLKSRATVACKVEVFPLKVREQAEQWPERGEREGRWFSPDEAAGVVEEAELREIIRKLPQLVEPETPAPA